MPLDDFDRYPLLFGRNPQSKRARRVAAVAARVGLKTVLVQESLDWPENDKAGISGVFR